MATQNTRIQITVSSNLAAAIRQVAKEEQRNAPGCILHILLHTPSIQDALKRVEEAAVVRNPEPVLCPAPALVVPQWTPQPPKPKPEVALRPDGKPYELGYPCTLGSGVTFHSCEDWAASSEFAAAYPKGT